MSLLEILISLSYTFIKILWFSYCNNNIATNDTISGFYRKKKKRKLTQYLQLGSKSQYKQLPKKIRRNDNATWQETARGHVIVLSVSRRIFFARFFARSESADIKTRFAIVSRQGISIGLLVVACQRLWKRNCGGLPKSWCP